MDKSTSLPQISDALLANRYHDNGDGTVTDIQTGLQWMRCALGQKWMHGTCTGTAEIYTWNAAMDNAEALGWRVPSIEELYTLIFGSVHPTICHLAFPNTPPFSFWTSTRAWSLGLPPPAKYVNFDNGHIDLADIHKILHVRLVRSKSDRVNFEEKMRLKRIYRDDQKIRDDLLISIRKILRDNFLKADLFFETSCIGNISIEEYDKEKTSFIRRWAKEKTGIELDTEQAAAIASVHGHFLVVARAGSGKTTTIVNRTLFLQKHCGIAPSEILLLAFNRKAKDEINRRLEKILGKSVPHVMTFHALAYAIVHPEQALLYNDSQGEHQGLNRLIQEVIDDYLLNEAFMLRVRKLMMAHFREDWEQIIGGGYNLSPEELLQFRRNLARETLRGEYVKSHGEKVIADFLFEHNIRYHYERNHWWNGLNYRPDFTLPSEIDSNQGIIIEYFGLVGDLNYDEQMQKKRDYWSKNQKWVLLEFTPNDLRGDVDAFQRHLKYCLEARGVRCERLTEDEIWRLSKNRVIDRFTKTMTSFIGRCRKKWILPNTLKRMIAEYNPLADIEKWFLDLTHELYQAYLDRLEATNQEDFDGLMQSAITLIEKGHTQFARLARSGDIGALQYILIDEYQDFSELFHRLVQSIRLHNPKAEFFCVGDDWQAINGFAGSDLNFYENFENYFSPSKRLYLSTNYRSVKEVVDAGNALMHQRGRPAVANRQNNGQIFKVDISSFSPTLLEEQQFSGLLTPIVFRLIDQVLAEGKTVILLNRRNHLFSHSGDIWALDQYLKSIRNRLPADQRDRISISTTHGFKGSEKDVVIVLDAYERSYPLIHQDWIFSRILGETQNKILDENRRLFYVALTRAKEQLFIITEQGRDSPFLKEIQVHKRISSIEWKMYPPPHDKTRWLVVKIEGPIELNEKFKAEGYRFRRNSSRSRYWEKSFLRKGFSIQTLKESSWAQQAEKAQAIYEFRVHIHDDYDKLIAHYWILGSDWICIQDGLMKAIAYCPGPQWRRN